jgi:hypothetical protein
MPSQQVCAYCGDSATHLITIKALDGSLVGAGYCCSEPTHWTWLLASCEEFKP